MIGGNTEHQNIQPLLDEATLLYGMGQLKEALTR